MIKIEIQSENFDKFKAIAANLNNKQQREVLRSSANEVARRLVRYFGYTIFQYVDRPKPLTVKSLFATYAKGDSIDSNIEFKVRTGKAAYKYHWLSWMVFGGNRKDKGLDAALRAFSILPTGYQAIPTNDIRTDGYGNVSGGYVTAMISYLRLDRSGTQNRGTGPMNARQRAKQRKGKKWWVERVGNSRGLTPGIYEYQDGALGKRVRLVFMFKQVSYRPTFPFFKLAEEYSNKNMLQVVKDRVDKLLRP